MIWTRLCITYIVFLSAAGSLSYGLTVLYRKYMRSLHAVTAENPVSILILQKLILILYWIPIPFLRIYFSRIDYYKGRKAYIGGFVCVTTPTMTIFFNTLALVWLAGFLYNITKYIVEFFRLYTIERGNIPVEHPSHIRIFETCHKQFHTKKVTLCQNDLLLSPITAGFIRQRIILPYKNFTETQLYMIYEHEFIHIQNKDIPWRLFGLITSWIHWFNPLIFSQLQEMHCLQEMVCDYTVLSNQRLRKESTSEDISENDLLSCNTYFTPKEYAVFMAELSNNTIFYSGTSAFSENKSQLTRRIEAMANQSKWTKPKKWIIGLGCSCLTALTIIPTTVFAEGTARLQEAWLQAEAVETEAEPQNLSDPTIEEHSYASEDDGVIEIYLGDDNIMEYSSSVNVEGTVDSNTRVVYEYHEMTDDDSISIVVKCTPSDAKYRIGIINKDSGKTDYITGTGLLSHTFIITESGTYSAYVENCSNSTITVDGFANYLN